MKLVVEFEFDDSSDFDFYRQTFVDNCKQMATDAQDKENDGEILSGPGRADGEIEISWDTED